MAAWFTTLLFSAFLSSAAVWADNPGDGFVENPALLSSLTTTAPLDRLYGAQNKLFADTYRDLRARNGGGEGQPITFRVVPMPSSSGAYTFEGRLEDFIVIAPFCQNYVLSVKGTYLGADGRQTYMVDQVNTTFTTRAQCL